jgi:hypothetical protein
LNKEGDAALDCGVGVVDDLLVLEGVPGTLCGWARSAPVEESPLETVVVRGAAAATTNVIDHIWKPFSQQPLLSPPPIFAESSKRRCG